MDLDVFIPVAIGGSVAILLLLGLALIRICPQRLQLRQVQKPPLPVPVRINKSESTLSETADHGPTPMANVRMPPSPTTGTTPDAQTLECAFQTGEPSTYMGAWASSMSSGAASRRV